MAQNIASNYFTVLPSLSVRRGDLPILVQFSPSPRYELPNFTLFFALLTLNNQESRIKKKCQKSRNDHESQRQVVDPFPHNFKASSQHMLE